MGDSKQEYDQGYADGHRDADKGESTWDIIGDALHGGPPDRSSSYKAGYDQGKSDAKK